MRALQYYGPGDVRLETSVPEPACQPHQVKIRPCFSGICGSDLFAWVSDRAMPYKDTPHPLTGETWPMTLGHEFSGEVVEVGSQAEQGLKVGDRVAVQPSICCGLCAQCGEGGINCCDKFGFVGLSGGGGGLSDFVCVGAEFAHRLPDSVPLDVGGRDYVALAEPLAVAWHAVDLADVQAGEEAIIMGAGPIGLAVLQCLRAKGAKTVIVSEMATERKEFATRFGATAVLDPKQDDVVAKAQELCGGRGPRVAFDCAGVEAGFNTAFRSVRKRGLVCIVSSWKKEVSVNFNALLVGEKRILTSLSYTTEDFKNVIEALGNGSLGEVGQMITSRIPINRVVDDGILPLLDGSSCHVKIMTDLSMASA